MERKELKTRLPNQEIEIIMKIESDKEGKVWRIVYEDGYRSLDSDGELNLEKLLKYFDR